MFRGITCLIVLICFSTNASAQFWAPPAKPTKAQEREMKRQAALQEKQQLLLKQQWEKEREKQQKLAAVQQKKFKEQMEAERLRRERDPKFAAEQRKKEEIANQQAVVGLAVLGIFLGMASDSSSSPVPTGDANFYRDRQAEQDALDRSRREEEARRSNDEWQKRLWSPDETGRSK